MSESFFIPFRIRCLHARVGPDPIPVPGHLSEPHDGRVASGAAGRVRPERHHAVHVPRVGSGWNPAAEAAGIAAAGAARLGHSADHFGWVDAVVHVVTGIVTDGRHVGLEKSLCLDP